MRMWLMDPPAGERPFFLCLVAPDEGHSYGTPYYSLCASDLTALLKSAKADNALARAYMWATNSQSISAANAKVYIEALEANRLYHPQDPDKADHTQLLYIIENLRSWRGPHAKESRQVLKDYLATIDPRRNKQGA